MFTHNAEYLIILCKDSAFVSVFSIFTLTFLYKTKMNISAKGN